MRSRKTVDASLHSQIALEAAREDAAVLDLAKRHRVQRNQIYQWKRNLFDNAASLFVRGGGIGGHAGSQARR